MASSYPRTGLSRKIVGYHLLFSLLAVSWLAVALVLAAHAILADRQAKHVLSRLGRAAAETEVHFLRHGAEGLGALLSEFSKSAPAGQWAIVGLDGKHLAHTDARQIGKPAEEPIGQRSHWGDAACIRYADSLGRTWQEYRVALRTKDRPLGDLRVSLQEPALLGTALAAARFIPLAVAVPLGLVVLGSIIVARLSRPVAVLETRLRDVARQPMGAPCNCRPLPARDAVSLGWNRVVDELERARRGAAQGDVAELLTMAEQQRRQSQFEQILQRLSDGIAVTDAEGRIAFANRAVAALLGAESELDALTGIQFDQRLREVADCSDDCDLLAAAARQRSAVGEVVQRGGDTERTLRVARLPLGPDASQGHVWTLRDVTQQKLVDQTRDHFIDTATHELRTPLANIKAYAETLASAECIDIELQKEFCNIINSEVTRLARFIDDLLSISSMEAGALSIERQPVETQRLFSEVLSKVEPLMQQKQIDFQVELPPKMPELNLDKDKIVAVVVNVLGNAAKYTPPGGRVSLHVKVEDGRLRASIEDTGFGIAPDDLHKVFDKFFRSDDPRVQAEVGTGLGLSLAREIVRMHGGEISVESELNKGSAFHVLLPLT
ncbi:MAG: hypothetical protein DCC67_02440 [Planctomycetota bacterium]|nr:MAG: hypothetical protein DCC67_02440 [Planctomycetota bacterium]